MRPPLVPVLCYLVRCDTSISSTDFVGGRPLFTKAWCLGRHWRIFFGPAIIICPAQVHFIVVSFRIVFMTPALLLLSTFGILFFRVTPNMLRPMAPRACWILFTVLLVIVTASAPFFNKARTHWSKTFLSTLIPVGYHYLSNSDKLYFRGIKFQSNICGRFLKNVQHPLWEFTTILSANLKCFKYFYSNGTYIQARFWIGLLL